MTMIAQGNKVAFQEVYRRYASVVLGYGIRILKDRSLAEDVAQDVWIRVIRLAASYRGQAGLKFWLMKVTRNAAMTFVRKRGIVAEASEDSQAEVSADPKQFEEGLLQSIEMTVLVKRIEALPEAQRVALVLWISEKLTYDEIATEMNISESAVKSLIFRARRSLETTAPK